MGNRRKYDKEFKEQVVLQILSGDKTVVEIAKELDVHHTTVREWIKSYRQDGENAFPGSGHLKPDDDEIRKLRKEIANLKEENDIFKKAAAYFAKNQK